MTGLGEQALDDLQARPMVGDRPDGSRLPTTGPADHRGALAWPIRSTRPVANAVPAIGSTSWYLIDDDPELITSTGMRHEAASAGVACAWIAVMATVLTMSGTSAPRDRSFTGLFSPCSTGPMAIALALRCTAL